MARRSDGSVVAWGDNTYGQNNVPPLPSGLSYVEIDAGYSHAVARGDDGSIVAWGNNGSGQTDVPALPAGLSYVEVAAAAYHTVARRSDGSVVAWGNNSYGQTDVPALPAGMSYVEISTGDSFTIARVGEKEGTWDDLARPLAGTNGPPLLEGEGTLIGGDAVAITLTNALENTTATLIVGPSELDTPLMGGVLVPTPTVMVFGLPTGPNGKISIPSPWPTGLPSSISLYFQHWIQGSAGPQGYAASNGLRATTP